MLLASVAVAASVVSMIVFLHWHSYGHVKRRIVGGCSWDLNICCGATDGGGVNVDNVRHASIPNFVLVRDIYTLPFGDRQFEKVLCSHTIEHLEYPDRFDTELRRIGRKVIYIVPPAWDLAPALNIWEHRWLFLTYRKMHARLPRRVHLQFARRLQSRIGQRITA